MKKLKLILLAGAAVFAAQVHAESKLFRSARAYATAQSFVWEEFLNGDKLLKEDGPIIGIGGEIQLNLGESFIFIGQAEFFGGDVDYDGSVQEADGTLTPTKSTTTYRGGSIAGKIGTPIALGKSAELIPHIGLGARIWERTLDTSYDDRYIGDNGYIEDWAMLHGTLGATISFPLGEKFTGFATAELRLPLDTTETVDLSNVGGDDDVDLEPEANLSFFAEAGIARGMFFASLYIETLDFDESDIDSSGQYLQPDSEATLIGGRAGVRF